MAAQPQCHEFQDRRLDATTVRDVLGDPKAWPFCISDDLNGIPDLRDANIVDVFVTRQRLFLYMIGATGTAAVAVFFVEDQELREKTADALQIGAKVAAALQARL